METNVSALYVSLFVEGPAVEFLDGDPEVIVLVESKNDMRVRFTDFGSQRHFHLRLVLRLSSGLQQIFF